MVYAADARLLWTKPAAVAIALIVPVAETVIAPE
jgi:hypothetical protein